MSRVDAMEALRRSLARDVVEALEPLIRELVSEEVEEALQRSGGRESQLLTYEQAGRLLDCSPDAVRKRAKRGRLEVRYHGRRAYVTRASLNRLDAWPGRDTL